MVSTLRACIAVLGLAATLALAVLQPKLNSEQTPHHFAMDAYLRLSHAHIPHAKNVEFYPHLLAAHPNAEAKAWELAHTSGNGPVYVTSDGHDKNYFVTTKIPSNSRLGQEWNLNFRGNHRDAYVLWHLKKKARNLRHPRAERIDRKLLRLDVWPVGGMTQEQETLQQILARIR